MRRRKPFLFLISLMMLASPAALRAGEVIYRAHGGNTASIQPTLDAFRLALGSNNGAGGTFATGRREISWDGVPAASLDPFPGNFFSTRGLVISTPGLRLKVSGDDTSASFLFRDVTAQWGATEFAFFSPQKFFAPIGSTVTDLVFRVPGTSTVANVSGFGAIFVDVDVANVSKIEFFDINDRLISSQFVDTAGVASKGFSFLGVLFNGGERAARVRITSGTKAIDTIPFEDSSSDGVAIDDFIYGEPRTASTSDLARTATGTNAAAIQSAIDQFRSDLGTLNANVVGSLGTGRREINWDGVPDASSSPNSFPPTFFNSNSPRGIVFSTSGPGFQVSARAANPTATPVRFGNLNFPNASEFAAFSPERLFTPVGSNVMDVTFFVPGGNVPASVSGFGAVFSDVDSSGSTSMEYFDEQGVSLGKYAVPATAGKETFSFLGVSFGVGQRVSRVRITAGNVVITRTDEPPSVDAVAMDDFIFGEPVENRARLQVTQYLAQIADGERYRTAVLLTNPKELFVSGIVEFLGDNGTPMTVTIGGRAGSSFDFALAPKGVLRLQTDGSSAVRQSGYARITADDGELDSVALFQLYGPANILTTEAGVQKSALLRAFEIFATTLNNVSTGVALVNSGTTNAAVTLKLLNANGSVIEEHTLTLAAGQHLARFVDELFDTVPSIRNRTFEGALLVSSNVALAATAVRVQLDPFLTISAIPVVPVVP